MVWRRLAALCACRVRTTHSTLATQCTAQCVPSVRSCGRRLVEEEKWRSPLGRKSRSPQHVKQRLVFVRLGWWFCCDGMTGQTSGTGAAFCCPYFLATDPNGLTWLQSTYYDAANVEGAHSCLALYATTGHPQSYDAYCRAQTWGPASHMLSSMQTSALSAVGQAQGVLSASAQLLYQRFGGSCPGGSVFTIGASVTATATPATAWSWMDGTPSSNLNCGSTGCGPWYSGYPAAGAGATRNANVFWGGGCFVAPGLDDQV